MYEYLEIYNFLNVKADAVKANNLKLNFKPIMKIVF